MTWALKISAQVAAAAVSYHKKIATNKDWNNKGKIFREMKLQESNNKIVWILHKREGTDEKKTISKEEKI